jgi:hypothetical protein
MILFSRRRVQSLGADTLLVTAYLEELALEELVR